MDRWIDSAVGPYETECATSLQTERGGCRSSPQCSGRVGGFRGGTVATVSHRLRERAISSVADRVRERSVSCRMTAACFGTSERCRVPFRKWCHPPPRLMRASIEQQRHKGWTTWCELKQAPLAGRRSRCIAELCSTVSSSHPTDRRLCIVRPSARRNQRSEDDITFPVVTRRVLVESSSPPWLLPPSPRIVPGRPCYCRTPGVYLAGQGQGLYSKPQAGSGSQARW